VLSLLLYSYEKQGLLDDRGLFSYERIEHVDQSAAKNTSKIRKLITELSSGGDLASFDIMRDKLSVDMSEEELEKSIQTLINSGIIYEPRRAYYKLI